MSEAFHVFVAVHGMGEQAPGEQVREFIETFLAASDEEFHGTPPALGLSRGFFREVLDAHGVILGSDIEKAIPAYQGKLDRVAFTEVFWADISEDQFRKLGVPFSEWSAGVLEQLRLREHEPLIAKRKDWLFPLLKVIRSGLNNSIVLFKPRFAELLDLALNRYMGDVQVYAETRTTPEKAVQRFHTTMDRAHAALRRQGIEKPQYHVIAHSLGTVLSLDALLTAHLHLPKSLVAMSAQQEESAVPSEWPVAAAVSATAKSHAWFREVKTFVTAGSPIDKFLVVWNRKFGRFLQQSTDSPNVRAGNASQAGSAGDLETRIRHVNFADEQDPFGNRLKLMYDRNSGSAVAELANAVFSCDERENLSTCRYPIPGFAHTAYYRDVGLVRRIQQATTTNAKPADPAKFEFLPQAFWRSLATNYFVVQTFLLLLMSIAFVAVVTAVDWKTKLVFMLPAAWFFWMVVPEFLWIVTAWRALVMGSRSAVRIRQVGYRQVFAMTTSSIVDALFVVSFGWAAYRVVIDANANLVGIRLLQVATGIGVVLILLKVYYLYRRATDDRKPKTMLGDVFWFVSISGFMVTVATMGCYLDAPHKFVVPITGAMAIAGAFDGLLRWINTFVLKLGEKIAKSGRKSRRG